MRDLYFIRMGDGPVKIGRSCDVKARLSCLRIGSPYPLSLLAVIPDGGHEEESWHSRFAADRLCGEWFEWSEALGNAISDIPNRGQVEFQVPAHWSKPRHLPEAMRNLDPLTA